MFLLRGIIARPSCICLYNPTVWCFWVILRPKVTFYVYFWRSCAQHTDHIPWPLYALSARYSGTDNTLCSGKVFKWWYRYESCHTYLYWVILLVYWTTEHRRWRPPFKMATNNVSISDNYCAPVSLKTILLLKSLAYVRYVYFYLAQ